jgi:hypothetical protein
MAHILAWHIGEFQQQDQPDQRHQDGAGTQRKGKLLWKRQHNKHNGHSCKADRAAQHSPIERSAAQPKPSNISKSAVPNQTPIAPCRLRPKRSEIAAGRAASNRVAVETIREAPSLVIPFAWEKSAGKPHGVKMPDHLQGFRRSCRPDLLPPPEIHRAVTTDQQRATSKAAVGIATITGINTPHNSNRNENLVIFRCIFGNISANFHYFFIKLKFLLRNSQFPSIKFSSAPLRRGVEDF